LKEYPLFFTNRKGYGKGHRLLVHRINDLRKRVDLGEASCLAIAKERGWIFLTDDDKARRIAKQLGVRLSGTIGVLVTAIEDKIISMQKLKNFIRI
jgi:predicted nucleic acid-binding protein